MTPLISASWKNLESRLHAFMTGNSPLSPEEVRELLGHVAAITKELDDAWEKAKTPVRGLGVALGEVVEQLREACASLRERVLVLEAEVRARKIGMTALENALEKAKEAQEAAEDRRDVIRSERDNFKERALSAEAENRHLHNKIKDLEAKQPASI